MSCAGAEASTLVNEELFAAVILTNRPGNAQKAPKMPLTFMNATENMHERTIMDCSRATQSAKRCYRPPGLPRQSLNGCRLQQGGSLVATQERQYMSSSIGA